MSICNLLFLILFIYQVQGKVEYLSNGLQLTNNTHDCLYGILNKDDLHNIKSTLLEENIDYLLYIESNQFCIESIYRGMITCDHTPFKFGRFVCHNAKSGLLLRDQKLNSNSKEDDQFSQNNPRSSSQENLEINPSQEKPSLKENPELNPSQEKAEEIPDLSSKVKTKLTFQDKYKISSIENIKLDNSTSRRIILKNFVDIFSSWIDILDEIKPISNLFDNWNIREEYYSFISSKAMKSFDKVNSTLE